MVGGGLEARAVVKVIPSAGGRYVEDRVVGLSRLVVIELLRHDVAVTVGVLPLKVEKGRLIIVVSVWWSLSAQKPYSKGPPTISTFT